MEKQNSEERLKKTNDGFLQEHEMEVKKMKEEFVKRKVKLKEDNDEMVCNFCDLLCRVLFIFVAKPTITMFDKIDFDVFIRDRAKKHRSAENL